MTYRPAMRSEHHWLPHPDLRTIDISAMLQALADPVRLAIVRMLVERGEGSCGSLDLPVNRSTISHHLRSLRDSGLVATRLQGTSRLSRVRWDEVEERFPGLLPAVVGAHPPEESGPAPDPSDTP
ncbi:ArsR/SmtB family transcription factor [Streptomonospora algeriensis]|uniref:ArsR/SmtB family transcription factor n=1 Tax=Streptomonospora algeriensis TaxID=995084 RepID=A0ABW3BAD4_9ACTN